MGRAGRLLTFGRALWNSPSKSTLAVRESVFFEGAGVSQDTVAFLSRHCSDPLLAAAVFFFSARGEVFQVPSTRVVSPFFGGSECNLGVLLGGWFFFFRKPLRSKSRRFLTKFRCLAFPSNAFLGGGSPKSRLRSKVDMRTMDGGRAGGKSGLWMNGGWGAHSLLNLSIQHLEVCSIPWGRESHPDN